ncbi:MAG: hypothetical protein KKB57_03100 [Proteobacteria bacterium]|nr:hypothetical protein [Pseudomonadota bacterium]MBU2469339.1 hypothetical protein [Pseudomonadota bacterium]MBU2516541.1 hypothetical protein [Pseudomonadota bacterium]
MAMAAALLALCLTLAACDSGTGGKAAKGGCTIAGQLEREGLVLVPLSAFTKKRMGGGEDFWSPLKLLGRPCLPSPRAGRVEIDERTEFYVFYSPPGAKAGLQVVFTWYHGRPERVLSQPQLKVLVKREGFTRPLAVSHIWSAPHGSSKLLSVGGLHSVQSKAQWEASRIYGPRTLVISRFEGFDQERMRTGETLARVQFEIHEKGVQVY